MARKRYTTEQIIGKLREAEVALAQGDNVASVVRQPGVAEPPYYRWRYLTSAGFQVSIAPLGATNFHPKVYAFLRQDAGGLVLGSANLSRRALTDNTEAIVLEEFPQLPECASDEADAFELVQMLRRHASAVLGTMSAMLSPRSSKLPTQQGRIALSAGGRPDDPEVLRHYYEGLLSLVCPDDRKIQVKRKSFNFPAIADAFRMIEPTLPVVVRYGDEAQQERIGELLEELKEASRAGHSARGMLRELQLVDKDTAVAVDRAQDGGLAARRTRHGVEHVQVVEVNPQPELLLDHVFNRDRGVEHHAPCLRILGEELRGIALDRVRAEVAKPVAHRSSCIGIPGRGPCFRHPHS